MKEEQIKNYIKENKRIWEANELTVEEIAERCLLDGEQLGVDRLNSTPRLLQILKDRGIIKSWYYNGTYHIGEVAELEKENAGLKASRPKWHKVADGDLPKDDKPVLIQMAYKNVTLGMYFNNTWIEVCNCRVLTNGVYAWCEIPKYTGE